MHIKTSDVKPWTDGNKIEVPAELDTDQEDAQSTIVLSKLASAFDTSGWADDTNTPKLIKKIIGMRYTSWWIQRVYSEDADLNAYAQLLLQEADNLIDGLISGTITIPDLPDGVDQGLHGPMFYPTDQSTILEPTIDDRSLGGPQFSMGAIF